VFDFELSVADMASMDALDKGVAGRNGPDPDTFALIM
jgi:2,5-diketo-D-gluconate reductase A